MSKLLIPLLAALALAVPSAALADGHGTVAKSGFAVRLVVITHQTKPMSPLMRLSGTGTSFAANSATVNGSVLAGAAGMNVGSFNASISTNWASATTKTVKWTPAGSLVAKLVKVTCAASTASVTLPVRSSAPGTTSNGSTATTSSLTSTFTGQSCAINRTGTPVYHFSGTSPDGIHIFLREQGTGVRGTLNVPATLTAPGAGAVTTSKAHGVDNIFLCYSAYQTDPGVWSGTVAPSLVEQGYWMPFAVQGNVAYGTNIGAYHLVCNLAAGQAAGLQFVDDGGAVTSPTAHDALVGVLGLYPLVGS